MKSMVRLGLLVGVFASYGLSACGGDSDDKNGAGSNIQDPVALCNAVTAAECKRIYECFSADILALYGAPADEAACVTEGRTRAACSSATSAKVCAGPDPYSLDQGNACIDQALRANCSTITSNLLNVSAYAPACGQCTTLGN